MSTPITSKARVEVSKDAEGRVTAVVTSIGGGLAEWELMHEMTAVLDAYYESVNAQITEAADAV
jgi:hypothetical protein